MGNYHALPLPERIPELGPGDQAKLEGLGSRSTTGLRTRAQTAMLTMLTVQTRAPSSSSQVVGMSLRQSPTATSGSTAPTVKTSQTGTLFKKARTKPCCSCPEAGRVTMTTRSAAQSSSTDSPYLNARLNRRFRLGAAGTIPALERFEDAVCAELDRRAGREPTKVIRTPEASVLPTTTK